MARRTRSRPAAGEAELPLGEAAAPVGRVPAMDPRADAAAFRAALTGWFDACGRDYPWRRTRDPYAILVSEVMLQQTRIATVLERGYYTRWLSAFPTVETLATAPEEAILCVWEGLGYYSRARNLQRAAQAVVTEHAGKFPDTVEKILTLPGVGRYTAGAVASFAWNLPAPVVDGNVARIFARLLAWDEEIDRPAVLKRLWAVAAELVSPENARGFNSALMELGQRICMPRRAECAACPVRPWCQSAGPAALARPRKSPPRQTAEVTEHVVFARKNGQVLLHQEQGRRRQGLWKLPERPAAAFAGQSPAFTTHYAITHHRVTLHVHLRTEEQAGEAEVWHPEESLATLPMPGPYRKVLDRIS